MVYGWAIASPGPSINPEAAFRAHPKANLHVVSQGTRSTDFISWSTYLNLNPGVRVRIEDSVAAFGAGIPG